MRVIAGTARSLPLKTPGGMDGPTTDRIKETLLICWGPIFRTVFVDIFSGSGGIGIEALEPRCQKSIFYRKCPEGISMYRG